MYEFLPKIDYSCIGNHVLQSDTHKRRELDKAKSHYPSFIQDQSPFDSKTNFQLILFDRDTIKRFLLVNLCS